jgi:cell division septation protein DedD
MSALDRLIDSAKERIDYLRHGQSRQAKLVTRIAFLAFAALFVSTIIPTMAQDSGANTQQESSPLPPQPAAETTTVDMPADSTTAVPLPSPSPDPTLGALPDSLKDSTTAIPAEPLKVQPRYKVRVPASLNVDPRAAMSTLPSLAASGSEFSLICVSGNNLRFDVATRRLPDSASNDSLLLAGDLSSLLRISGKTGDALALLNSVGGMSAYSSQSGIAGKALTISFVAMGAPDISPEFCAASQNSAQLSFRALALEVTKGVGTVKLK